jgi:PIN domain nuclease of toxin-antitoxin system
VRLLVDTHAFLWWRSGARLAKAARAAMQDPGNDVFVSAAVAWEIVIKRTLGKLRFDGAVREAIEDEGFLGLPITAAHVDELARLPGHHRDPFDRVLVAQARTESLTLVTRDPALARYDGFAVLRC